MQAKVIEVDDQNIYLEIDRQLRFESKYVSNSAMGRIEKAAVVDFRFSTANGYPVIVVNRIVPTSAPAAI